MNRLIETITIRLLSLVFLLGFSGLVVPASAQSVVGVSEILDSTTASEIDTYSATELSYDVSLYYGAYVEGYLFDGSAQIRWGSAQAQQLADGYLQAPVTVGDVYRIESDHYLILSIAYFDGSSYQYNNPYGFMSGDGDYPSGSSFSPGGGPAYVSTQYYYLGTTVVSLATAAPSITSINPTSVATGKSGTIEVEGNNLIDPFTSQTTPAASGSGVILSVNGTPSSSHVSLNYSVDANASAVSRSLTLATRFGTGNANLAVGYPPAVVSSLSPSVWQAGSNFTLTISGSGFGTAPTVSVSGAAGVSAGQAMNTSVDGTQTHVTVNVAVDAPDGTATVQVQPGYTGNGYTCGNCNGSSPVGSNLATVVGAPPPQNSCPAMLDSSSGFSGIAFSGLAAGGSGTMTVSFGGGSFNGYGVTVPYGKFSTPESVASHLAALITQKYYKSGLTAEAYGAYILYKGNATLGAPNFTSSGSSSDSPFKADPAPQSCPPVSINLRLVPVVSRNESISSGTTILHNVWRLVTLVGGKASLDYRVVEHIAVSRNGTEPDGQGGYQSPKNGVEAPVNIFDDGIGCLLTSPCTTSPPYWQKFTITQMNGQNPGSTIPVFTRINGQDHLINTIYEHGINAPTMNDPNRGPLPQSPDPYPQLGDYPCFTCR
ncbi:hypothetical protein [Granulicella sp. dw_53]|uniref:hypothetical protein n=1 Tax=Granulicella sp. dw_53 TaxID=2719792 RepID=UPI001BD4999B|nr:hypothetical protein [Granulicella sp. dw_53]